MEQTGTAGILRGTTRTPRRANSAGGRHIMTIGQVTFIAVAVSVHGITADQAMHDWEAMRPNRREAWETAGQAVQAFYETGIEGAC